MRWRCDCGWEGEDKDLATEYVEIPGEEDVEPVGVCPKCGGENDLALVEARV